MIEHLIDFITTVWADYECAVIEWFNGGDPTTSARIICAMDHMWSEP